MTQYVGKSAMVASIQEAYCSYEVSKLLKEKGFDWECTSHFNKEGKVFPNAPINFNITKYWISRPTHQMAMKWLREKGIHINAFISYDYSVDADGNEVDRWIFWIFEILSSISGELIYIEEVNEYDSYEEAVEAALKYSLKNLL